MKIVFMGTPDFAVASLDALMKSGHEIMAVVTTPDKQRGRGQRVTYTAVKEFAMEHQLPVLQPDSMKDPGFIDSLRALQPDLFVIVAFRILPREVFSIPPMGSFNLHGSLLPKYRGAAPIQWALINGERETGVTTFFLQDKVDTGNIITSEKIRIEDSDDFGTLHDKLAVLGASVVIKTVGMISSGSIELSTQDDSIASAAPKINKEICHISWNRSAEDIHNLIRGLSPYPGAFFYHNGKQIKIYRSEVDNSVTMEPGAIRQSGTQLLIGCNSGAIRPMQLQLEGRKRLSVEEFLRGYSFD